MCKRADADKTAADCKHHPHKLDVYSAPEGKPVTRSTPDKDRPVRRLSAERKPRRSKACGRSETTTMKSTNYGVATRRHEGRRFSLLRKLGGQAPRGQPPAGTETTTTHTREPRPFTLWRRPPDRRKGIRFPCRRPVGSLPSGRRASERPP